MRVSRLDRLPGINEIKDNWRAAASLMWKRRIGTGFEVLQYPAVLTD